MTKVVRLDLEDPGTFPKSSSGGFDTHFGTYAERLRKIGRSLHDIGYCIRRSGRFPNLCKFEEQNDNDDMGGFFWGGSRVITSLITSVTVLYDEETYYDDGDTVDVAVLRGKETTDE